MSRAKHAVARHRRKKRILKAAKGQRGGRSRLLRTAKESTRRSLKFSYTDRKLKKREFRRLWIVRIKAAANSCGISYGEFMNGLKKAKVALSRKSLAELAVNHKVVFNKLVKLVQENLDKPH
jgi:large subunit ribosomal protein L20